MQFAGSILDAKIVLEVNLNKSTLKALQSRSDVCWVASLARWSPKVISLNATQEITNYKVLFALMPDEVTAIRL